MGEIETVLGLQMERSLKQKVRCSLKLSGKREEWRLVPSAGLLSPASCTGVRKLSTCHHSPRAQASPSWLPFLGVQFWWDFLVAECRPPTPGSSRQWSRRTVFGFFNFSRERLALLPSLNRGRCQRLAFPAPRRLWHTPLLGKNERFRPFSSFFSLV